MQFTTEQQQYIDEHYLLLPVDADGVPIHVGDELRGYGLQDGGAIVKALNGTMVIVGRLEGGENYAKSGLLWSASETRHYNPRTVEDVLVDMLETAVGYSDAHTTVALGAVERYAAEIRDLLGGDGR